MPLQMIQYPFLPPGGAYNNTVSANHPFMLAAKRHMEQSGCRKHATSAVIVKDGAIIAQGSNAGTLVPICPRVYKGYGTGEGYRYCKEYCGQHGHAEIMAVRDGQAKGIDMNSADIYLYGHWWACKNCWEAMQAAGINTVYVTDQSHEVFNDQARHPGDYDRVDLKLYVSGGLTNLVDETRKSLYEQIGQLGQKHGFATHVPHLATDPLKNKEITPEEVYAFDLGHLKDSDVVIAYVGVPSLGVGIELEWAVQHKALVVLLSENGRPISRLARGNPAVVDHILFDTPEEAIEKLDAVLAKLVKAAKRKNMSTL
ncbi:MAG: hypothetical protein HY461_03165 [Parcubacteria group bacterium]|nr:hypothetical protein [Parcubacteria group bacterium]